MTIPTDAVYAAQLDAHDPLARFRESFVFDEEELVYLDGNSLGRLPKASVALAEHLVREQWGKRLIRGWNEGWFDAPERIGAKIARLIGARPDEVIVADSTSVNLFKLVVAALRRQRNRTRILSDNLNFRPTSTLCKVQLICWAAITNSSYFHRATIFTALLMRCAARWTSRPHSSRFRTRYSKAATFMTWPGSPQQLTRAVRWCYGISVIRLVLCPLISRQQTWIWRSAARTNT